ncbi:MAG: T9SS type A sorting domain-containing protein [Bacteroidales bacterium]
MSVYSQKPKDKSIKDAQTWTGKFDLDTIQYIGEGGVLTLDAAKINFKRYNSGFHVMPGGKLIIKNGSSLTSQNNLDSIKLWKGIFVKPLLSSFNNLSSATVIIENSTIEHADMGVYCEDIGIVKATNCSFKNCGHAILFNNCHSKLEQEILGKTHFKNCRFIIDDFFRYQSYAKSCYEGGSSFYDSNYSFLQVENYPLFVVEKCYFKNDRINDSKIKPIGIFVANSDVHIFDSRTNHTIDETNFLNLYVGVYADTGIVEGDYSKVCILDQKFTKCSFGVLSRSSVTYSYCQQSSLMVKNCKFEDLHNGNAGKFKYSGITLFDCLNFDISDNYFEPYSNQSSSMGIHIFNYASNIDSYPAKYNELYHNHFDRLELGMLIEGANRNGNVGLCFRCNDFSTCRQGVKIGHAEGNCTEMFDGIAPIQGGNSIETAANNLFSVDNDNSNSIQRADIYNNVSEVEYVYYPHENDKVSTLPNPFLKHSLNKESPLLGYTVKFDYEKHCKSRRYPFWLWDGTMEIPSESEFNHLRNLNQFVKIIREYNKKKRNIGSSREVDMEISLLDAKRDELYKKMLAVIDFHPNYGDDELKELFQADDRIISFFGLADLYLKQNRAQDLMKLRTIGQNRFVGKEISQDSYNHYCSLLMVLYELNNSGLPYPEDLKYRLTQLAENCKDFVGQLAYSKLFAYGFLRKELCEDAVIYKNSKAEKEFDKENKIEENWTVSPNPCSRYCSIKSKKSIDGKWEVLVRNIEGQIVTQICNIQQDEIRLDVSTLANGIYFIVIKKDNRVLSSKKISVIR